MISLPDFFSGLFLVPVLMQAWLPSAAVVWNAPAWSLSVEALFYVLFPVLIRRLAAPMPLKLLVVALLSVMVSSAFRAWFASAPGIPWGQNDRHNFVAYFPALFLPHFVYGLALCRCFLQEREAVLAMGRAAGPSAVLLVVLFCARSRVPGWVMSDAVLVPLFGAVILGGARATGQAGRFLSSDHLVLLGEASYALYILHVPLAFWWQWIALRFDLHPFDSWLGVAIFSAVAVLLSCAVFTWVERPARRWILQWAALRERRPAAESR